MAVSNGFSAGSATLVAVLLITLAGCNSGGSDGGEVSGGNPPPVEEETPPVAGTVPVTQIQAGTAQLAVSDPTAPFSASLPDGVAAVTVSSPAVVNFVLTDTAGRVVTGLQGSNLRVALAKLVPGSPGVVGVEGTGEADEWVSYIYRTKSGSAITDGVQATYESGTAGTLSYHEAGYYSYAMATDIVNATRPEGTDPIWDPAATHRVAIQLELRDQDDNRILFNPHFDFRFDGGASVALTDPAQTHRVADEASCNECHNQLIAHGGRVETEYCVMCHNPGSIDVEFGSPIDFKVMVHKIHKGRALESEYRIAGFGGTVHEWSDVGYPQDLRNCSKCHDSADPETPQGDYWNLRPTQQACLSCHEDVDFNQHQGYDFIADDGTEDNSACRACHGGASSDSSVVNVHWNQLEEHSKNYRFNILNLDYDGDSRSVSITYSMTDPASGQPYDLTEGLTACLAAVEAGASPGDCRDLEGAPFSRFSLYLASLTLPSANPGIDDYSNRDASVYAWMGTPNDDGSYTATLQVPAEALGTARLLSSGQAQERKVVDVVAYRNALAAGVEITAGNAAANGVEWDWDQRVRVPVINAVQDFSVDGSALNARRVVVADAKCNDCHSLLGSASGSNTKANAFHRGERSSVVACAVCHTPNQASSTEMSDEIVDGGVVEPVIPGTNIRMNQSYEFKTMIHGIHGAEARATPYMHGDEDLSGETQYPGILADCTACHAGNTYNVNAGAMGAAVTREDDLEQRRVFSPYAAACMGCHDSAATRTHMSTMGVGGASVGDFTQEQWLNGAVYERCAECHGPGGGKDVRVVHGIE
jgi:OmcA/MtrC family decaheme c-type cytochrome